MHREPVWWVLLVVGVALVVLAVGGIVGGAVGGGVGVGLLVCDDVAALTWRAEVPPR
jgi:hypothetical protein